MTQALSPVVRQQAWKLGIVAPGAVLSFFLSGTSTPTQVFDAAGVSLGTSLTADSSGRFVAFWLAPIAYRMTMVDSVGATIWGPQDGINSPLAAAGSTTQVMFNDAGDLAGDAGLTYNKTTDALTLVGAFTPGSVVLNGAAVGIWASVTFNAANFAGSGAMTWTVASGDQITLAYVINNKSMTVAFDIETSTVGGTPTNELRITIPAGKTAARKIAAAIFVNDNGGGSLPGYCFVNAAGTFIGIRRSADATWSASADLTSVFGEITFEIS